MSLNGKVVVVTGGGSGMGRACSVQLGRDGAAVAVWDLNGAGADETVAMIAAEGGRAISCPGDAARGDEIAVSLKRTRDELGPVGILVNAAAITGVVKVLDVSEDYWDRMIAINLKGPFLCVQAVLPDMLAAGWGRIVNIASSSAQAGVAMMSPYVASKGGVIGLSKALATELVRTGVTVNAVSPGSVDTPMLRASPIDVDAHGAGLPMGRLGRPEKHSGRLLLSGFGRRRLRYGADHQRERRRYLA